MQRSWMPALVMIVAALAVPPEVAGDDRSQRWVVRALDAEADGDLAAATAAARKAVEADAEDGDAQYHLGRFLLVAGDAAAALAALDAAEAAGRAAPIERAAAMQRLGRSQEAVEALKPALAVTEPEGAAWLLQGHLMVDTGDDAAALDAYGRAISDASTAAAGRLAKARVLQRQGRADEALAEARKAANEATDERTARAARDLVAAIEGPKRWNLRVMLGHQVDTNVVLLQTDERVAAASFAPQEISDRIGNRWTLTLGGEYRLPLGDGGQVGFGYSGYQSYHRTHRETLQRYDVGAHSPMIRYIWKRGRMSGTAPVRFSWTLLGPLFGSEGTDTTRTDLRLYSRSIDFAPSLAFALSETARLFGVGAVSAVDFTEPDRSVVLGGVETSLVRSNLAFSLDLGAAWTMLESGELRGSIGLIRSEAWGLVNAWDDEGLRLRLRARTPNLGPVHVVLAGEAARRFYDHAYPVPDATNASGFAAVDRTDDALQGSATLRAGWKQLVGDFGVTVQRNMSSVSLFDYRRTIVSLAIGAEL